MSPFARAQLNTSASVAVGLGVFAAIVLPGNVDWLRFAAGAVAFILVSAGLALGLGRQG